MAFNLPPDFDPDSSDWSQGDEPSAQDIADRLGFETWADIMKDNDDLNPQNVRPGAYLTPQEAMRHANDLPFSDFDNAWFLWYDGEDDTWHIVVDY